MTEKDLLSVKEMSEYLGCGRTQSYALLQPGPRAIPAYRVGRKIVVRRADIDLWLEGNPYKSELSNELRKQ